MRYEKDHTPSYGPSRSGDHKHVAVAIESDESNPESIPSIAAAGRGKLADDIVSIAFANGIKVREDADLAQLLVQLELDTPIPSEAILVVAEILAKVYEANESAVAVLATKDGL